MQSLVDVVRGLSACMHGGSPLPLIIFGVAAVMIYIISIDWISTMVGPSMSAYMTMLGSAVAFMAFMISGNLCATTYGRR